MRKIKQYFSQMLKWLKKIFKYKDGTLTISVGSVEGLYKMTHRHTPGKMVVFFPGNDKSFPWALNGAESLPAIILQDLDQVQHLSVFTPFDGVKTAFNVPERVKLTESGDNFWIKLVI